MGVVEGPAIVKRGTSLNSHTSVDASLKFEGPAIVKRGTSLNSHASLDASLNNVITSIKQTRTCAAEAVPQQLTRQVKGGAPEIVPEGPVFTRRPVQRAY